jgi:branched-chain amino acid transport system permease protein
MKQYDTSLSSRSRLALAGFVLAMLSAPALVSPYILSLLIGALFAAFLGQAWNFMMGFAGQLSLGHSLYIGLGGYASAALFTKLGVPPWFGMLVGMALCAVIGSVIAALSFRFGITGVYFALLTIAFAEFTRILFDHFGWVGGSAGLFLPVANATRLDLVNLRGIPVIFYYCMLVLTLGSLGLGQLLLGRRIGLYWQAIREDQIAAETLGINIFRYKIAAIALSAAMTGIGGTFLAFYDNNLYPDTVFSMSRSVEVIVPPILGGIGTLFGPIVGAFAITALSELTTRAAEYLDVNGFKQLLYGALLLLVVSLRPAGIWPWLKARLGLEPRSP